MISFIVALAVLFIGYVTYGRVTDKVFGPDDRTTPAVEINDGVDCVPIKTWKALLIQLLNIAGTGPIFGALMGACFGPVVFILIVFGSILGGAVHDYMCGMISERNKGASIAELSGIYLGKPALYVMRVFSILLLLLTGTVFVTSPAALISKLFPIRLGNTFWIVVILIYYILATLLPIDKVIGKLYPVFGVILIVMALSIAGGIIFLPQYQIPEVTLRNLNPEGLPVWPFMFITVACGAISGFHATQSPMMSKCIMSEKDGRKVFYGAMIIESVIALIWAAAGVAFYGSTHMLQDALTTSGQSGVVYEISEKMLGSVGGMLAIIGIVVCPITSGDTAFRSARLILAEWTKLDQKKIKFRLLITLPLLAASAVLTQLDFNVLWRYFSWSNQTLAMIALWVATSYLVKNHKNKIASLITAIPATFMSAVSVTYILMAKEGFKLSSNVSYPAGIAAAAVLFVIYVIAVLKYKKQNAL
ncbi:MAG: carbon starvation CstA family protein [Oscillospiraceae bacterium]|nr:carbon starvation CstA family protein [Oscillospiraceae bacterium]